MCVHTYMCVYVFLASYSAINIARVFVCVYIHIQHVHICVRVHILSSARMELLYIYRARVTHMHMCVHI